MKHIRVSRPFLFALSLLLPAVAPLLGQSVYWVPSSGTLQSGKTNQLQLHFEGCEPVGEVQIPSVPNLDLVRGGISTQTRIINTKVIRKHLIEYQAIPSSQGRVTIPSFEVETDEGTLQVDAVSYQVVEATIGNTGLRPQDIFYSELSAMDESIYVGEVFPIRYILGVKQGHQLNDISLPSWDPDGIVTTGLENYQQARIQVPNTNEQYIGLIYEGEGMATLSGQLNLPKARQTVSMIVGQQRSFFFNEPILERYNVETDPLVLRIKPLPNSAPPSFSGAVGDFSLESKVVPQEVQLGEPITWTLTLSGRGNWPQGIGLPAREISTAFRAIQPELRTEHAEDDIFQGTQTEDIVLIPTREGSYQIGPVEFSFFDPASERYKTIVVPEKSIQVAAVSPSQTAGSAAAAGGPAPTQEQADAAAPAPPPPQGIELRDKPIELPTDPVSVVAQARVPEGRIPLAGLLPVVLAPLALWLLLGLGRAFLLDPHRPRRQAWRDLRAIASAAGSAPPSEIAPLLRRWRQAARRYWGLDSEEPSSEALQAAVAERTDAKTALEWRELWEQSDQALFGNGQPLQHDWATRLSALLRRAPKRHAAFAPPIFSRRAWAGVALLALSLALFGASRPAAADEALAHYNSGQFGQAASIWQQRLMEEPLNWAHRHNLGLAAAQRENWGQASAYWTSAFVLNPQQPDLRWNLRLAQARTRAYDERLLDLLEEGILAKTTRLLTPAGWERLAWGLLVGSGAALCLCVAAGYVARLRFLRASLLGLGLAMVALFLLARFFHGQYGLLASPQAVLVAQRTVLKSVPTDFERPAQTAGPQAKSEEDAEGEGLQTELPDGAIALLENEFLGWAKVRMPNGESGWTRQEALVPLYGAWE